MCPLLWVPDLHLHRDAVGAWAEGLGRGAARGRPHVVVGVEASIGIRG